MKNERGFATIEASLLLTVFIVLLSYGVGFFGVIHSGILSSIAARAYAWEIFANRTNVTYLRDGYADVDAEHYRKIGFRAHSVISEVRGRDSTDWIATERSISIRGETENAQRNPATHNDLNVNLASPKIPVDINPVWIRTVYGICLDAKCGGIEE